MYLILAVLSLSLFFILKPVIIGNIRKAGIPEKIKGIRDTRDEKDMLCRVSLCRDSSMTEAERRTDCSRTLLHSVLEALLLPLSDEEKRNGLTTYISGETRLTGVSEKDGYIFVVLSRDFLSSPDVTLALEQIKKTLAAVCRVESLTVISGEKVFRL